ncbi:MAG: L,D-transpeptidase family protein [Candidatus Omnitrophica bacterium]|nr:L,D-transpeptidase family protein [Candidatus Omnitrophota bacterium]MBU2265587.1 L,D-transpeptidase family protein [Candidatus Omnitrophota bacterium]
MKKIYIIIIGAVGLAAIFILAVFSSKKPAALKEVSHPSVSQEADQALSAERLKEAKELYEKSSENLTDPATINNIRQKVETINMKILFSPEPSVCSTVYKVQPKDTLTKIARKHNTTVELIKRSNNLTSDRIVPNQNLKVTTCKFSLVIDKSQNLLFLKREGEVIKTYGVSTGKDNSTPVGEFAIDNNKLKNPTWFRMGAVVAPDSPENILGSRWMGLEGVDSSGERIKGYGIHGTTEPEKLGQQVTLGCIRMKNQDVEELFDIIPTGTKVTIID